MTTTPDTVACPSCAAMLAPDAAFCSRCGRPTGRRIEAWAEQWDAAELRTVMPPRIRTRIEATAHLRIDVQTGSFADQQAAAVGQRLEGVLGAVATLFGIPPPDGPFSVYLGEVLRDPAQAGKTLTSGSFAVPERREVWGVFRSDAPGVDLERTFLRLILLLHTGKDLGQAPLLLDGALGLVGQVMGQVPPPETLSPILGGAIAAGAWINVRPMLGGPSESTAQLYPLVATLFSGFLLNEKGPEAYLTLLAGYDPQNPDTALMAVYGQPLLPLKLRWLEKSWPQTALPAPGGEHRGHWWSRLKVIQRLARGAGAEERPRAAGPPPPRRAKVPVTAEQRRELCQLLVEVLIEIRWRAWHGESEQVGDLADAVHNLPLVMYEPTFSWSWCRDYLQHYQEKYPQRGDFTDYVGMVERISKGYVDSPLKLTPSSP